MTTHKLALYEIRFRRPKKWSYNLRRFQNIPGIGKYQQFEEFMAEFFNSHLGDSEADKSVKKTFSTKEYYQANNTILGKIRTGEWGFQQDRWNIEEEEREENARDTEDAMETDFYFHVGRNDSLPKESAILILEQFKGWGAKNILQRQLADFVDHENVRVEVNRIFTNDIVRQLKKADNLLRFKLETEYSPMLEFNHEEKVNNERRKNEEKVDESMRQTIEIKPQPGKELPVALDDLIPIVGDEEKELGFGRVYDFEIADASVVLDESGSERTVSIEDGDNVKMVEILNPKSSKVRISSDRVRKGSMARHSERLLDDVTKSYEKGNVPTLSK